MIDIETMSVTTGSAIVSIGAVLFSPNDSKVYGKNTFYTELAWETQGREIDESTREWWKPQSGRVKEALGGSASLKEALQDLSEWLPRGCKVWGNGPTFDISILQDAYTQEGLKVPWKFYDIRDCRTVVDMYESTQGKFYKKAGEGAHNALHDALYQAKYVTWMWKKLLKSGN